MADQHQLGMAAGDDQAKRGEFFAGRVAAPAGIEPVGIKMPFQVVDANQRNILSEGNALSGIDAHQQAAGQPRPIGYGDRIQFIPACSGLDQGILNHRANG